METFKCCSRIGTPSLTWLWVQGASVMVTLLCARPKNCLMVPELEPAGVSTTQLVVNVKDAWTSTTMLLGAELHRPTFTSARLVTAMASPTNVSSTRTCMSALDTVVVVSTARRTGMELTARGARRISSKDLETFAYPATVILLDLAASNVTRKASANVSLE